MSFKKIGLSVTLFCYTGNRQIPVLFVFWDLYQILSTQLFFFLFFFGSPSTVGLFSSATLKYGLVAWQTLRSALQSSWNVCLFSTVAIFAALICQLGPRAQIFHSLLKTHPHKIKTKKNSFFQAVSTDIRLEFK